jgi:hypothetical protein
MSPIENDGVDSRRVDLIENCFECWQVAMDVGQHRDSHEDPSQFRSTTLWPAPRRKLGLRPTAVLQRYLRRLGRH